jgi:regulatory protein
MYFGLTCFLLCSHWKKIARQYTPKKDTNYMGWEKSKGKSRQQSTALACGMEYLVRRARSTEEMRLHLTDLEYPESEIFDTIDSLTKQGLLDDEKFARDFADFRLRHGKGEIAIKRDLAERGVDGNVIDNAIDSLDKEDVGAAAQKLALKAAQRYDIDDATYSQKVIRYVASHGFTFDQAKAAAARVCKLFPKRNI